MAVETLDDLMFLRSNGPSLKEFDARPAVQAWAHAANRYFAENTSDDELH